MSIFERLRAPDGCAWDRERSLADLGKYLREECDEVVGAIAAITDVGDGTAAADPPLADAVREECGDLLANLVFTVQIARERGWFDMEDVARGACEKIVRRPPPGWGAGSGSPRGGGGPGGGGLRGGGGGGGGGGGTPAP